MPTFTWDTIEVADNLPIVKMMIEFNDGGLPDMAILNRNPLGISDEAEEAENECILTGFLRDEDDVPVTVAGCPGSDTFDVRFSTKITFGFWLLVFFGPNHLL